MYVRIVTFRLGGLTSGQYRQHAEEFAPAFLAWPGLHTKIWLAGPEHHTDGGRGDSDMSPGTISTRFRTYPLSHEAGSATPAAPRVSGARCTSCRSRHQTVVRHEPIQSSRAIDVAAPITDNTPAPTESDRSRSRVERRSSVLRRRHIAISHRPMKMYVATTNAQIHILRR